MMLDQRVEAVGTEGRPSTRNRQRELAARGHKLYLVVFGCFVLQQRRLQQCPIVRPSRCYPRFLRRGGLPRRALLRRSGCLRKRCRACSQRRDHYYRKKANTYSSVLLPQSHYVFSPKYPLSPFPDFSSLLTR